jgi:hypothetical protein
MESKQNRKNPHAVALGRLGGLVCSEAKNRACKENGRKGGFVKSRKKTLAETQCAPAKTWTPQRLNLLVEAICARFGDYAFGRGNSGIRYSAAAVRQG